MVYKTGTWGEQAKARYKKRIAEYRERRRKDLEGEREKERIIYLKKTGKNSVNLVVSNRIIKARVVGLMGEREAEKLLGVKKNLATSDVDFNWRGKLVDVKTARINKKGEWKFLLYKQKGVADLFLIICKDRKMKTEHIFLIPDKDLLHCNLSISRRSLPKYLKYTFQVRP